MKRVRRPHGLLPKTPQNGDKIVVVLPDDKICIAYVRRATGGRRIEYRRRGVIPMETVERVPHQSRGGTVRRRDEGLTWARGWDTPEAAALRVAAALS